jgi:SMC interacting uncharacterized protein involved in chromosome segregation
MFGPSHRPGAVHRIQMLQDYETMQMIFFMVTIICHFHLHLQSFSEYLKIATNHHPYQ